MQLRNRLLGVKEPKILAGTREAEVRKNIFAQQVIRSTSKRLKRLASHFALPFLYRCIELAV